MLEINLSDPNLDWDAFNPEDLVTARITQDTHTEDGERIPVNLDNLGAAEDELRTHLNDEQKERRDQHAAEQTKKAAQRMAKHLTNQPAFRRAMETMQREAARRAKDAFKNSDFASSATKGNLFGDPVDIRPRRTVPSIPQIDYSKYEPAPDPTPGLLHNLAEIFTKQHEETQAQTVELQAANATLQAQLTEQKDQTQTAKTAAAEAEERAIAAEESAQRSTYLTVASILVAILGIAASIHFSTTPPDPQTPPQPAPTPTIKQTIE